MYQSKLNHVYQAITDTIIQAIERKETTGDTLGWSGFYEARPINPVTGKLYRGANVIHLSIVSEAVGYALPLYAGFRQWINAGCKIKKHSRGVYVLFAKPTEVINEEDESVTIEWRTGYHKVFNIEQVEGWKSNAKIAECVKMYSEDTSKEGAFGNHLVPAIEHLIKSSGVDIRTSNKAYFSHTDDFIAMPPISSFALAGNDGARAVNDYYAVLLHELTHSTGHKSRLKRHVSGDRGSKAYAFEELVAEIGAAFFCGSYGLQETPRASHVQYIAYYLEILKSDNRAILRAANLAEQSCNYLSKLADNSAAAKAA